MSARRITLRAADPLVADHRIGGVPVVPAAAQIDALLSACDADRPDRVWTLEQIAFRTPLTVPGTQTGIEVGAAGQGRYAVRSVPSAPGAEPVEHSAAQVSGSPLPPPRYVDVAGLRAGCTQQVPLADMTAWRDASGITYGPAYRVIRSAHRGPGRMLLMLRAEDGTDGGAVPPFVPPPLLDSVFQALGMLDDGSAGACLPWYVGRLVARRRISGTVIALVERDEPAGTGGASRGAVRGRAVVCNQQGEVLLELDRITLKAAGPVAPSRALAPAAPTAPVPSPRSASVPAAPAAGGPAGEERAPAAVPTIETLVWREADPLTARSADPGTATDADAEGTVLLVAARAPRVPEGRQVLHLTPERLADEGLDALPDGTVPRDVVYVAPDGPADDAAAATEALQGVFALVRRIAARPPMPGLLIVTGTAHAVTEGEAVDPLMTALWGLGRTLRVEHPRSRVRLADLGSGREATAGPEGDDGAALWEALRRDGTELALRDGVWYEPSLQPAPPAPVREVRYRGGRFLITGGMGGIGLSVAEFLADEGCARLTLVGRTVPDRGAARERLDRLAGRCDLDVVTADVRSLGEVLSGPFDGVFHAAGVLRDGLARSLTPDRVDAVLGPKVGGAHALAGLVADGEHPGFVVLFSSIAAVRANLGQSAYAAANGYLDGYAARRRAEGLPWYSLGWGLWTVGMGEAIAPKAAAHGIAALGEDDGIALLRTALGRPPAHYVLSAAKAKDAPMTAVTPDAGLWPTLTLALRKVLHVDSVSPEDDLLELGLDSMMAVELAAALAADGLDVDPMVFFERTGVGTLLTHLESLPRAAAPAAPPAARAGAALSIPTPREAPYEAPTTPVTPPPAAPATAVRAPAQPPVPEAPVRPAADGFVPDWDRFRDPGPTSANPAAPPAPAAPVARAAPVPAPARTAPPLAGPATASAAGADPAAGSRTPRRTLPGRLADAPHGTFLDRRIDALSAEDRGIVAKGEYFYEPVIEEASGSRIKFDGRWYLNFASYSYLGLIGHPYIDDQALRAVEQHGTGAHGVRLLAGTLHLHRELELALARFLGAEDAIVFSSGYMANVATVGALVGPGDTVLGDVYNHASILDGYRLSGAKVVTYAHNDLADLERALRKAGDGGRLVVTDAVFSMDGDVADLPGILELCERYDAPLMVDEAHSLGVLGDTGRGITEHFGIDPDRVHVKMGTLSKTVPSAGGYVAGSRDLIFALKNNARGWMFSAAATPAQVAAAKAAVEVMAAAPSLTRELRARTTRYRDQLHALGFDTLASETPVVPVICATADQAVAMARLCQLDGLFVQPIVYPAVPRTLPRLRTIVNLSHTEADLDAAVMTLEKAGRACGLIR
ncbi:bifunctional SDR family oxidoreductase/pyridoxal phosphate-dependent aminotransferase family protein [Streptomyces thermolilacinus]|uniref:8-amino-7-oxononanoate synthase n=1 Tax=Streptomyces thermolilacinus SPC6 TaxID=1306406 RepID=A0A1D3DNV8_9ACTN|nr:bifunctional SDR family oxidoreductase/pyridoxal phosphate-dependent aminotransferase family protein [Streptomyces thermolilacinus]OEJ94008.1 aminotransferase [Streptomyces thermolilacinus SPC6]